MNLLTDEEICEVICGESEIYPATCPDKHTCIRLGAGLAVAQAQAKKSFEAGKQALKDHNIDIPTDK